VTAWSAASGDAPVRQASVRAHNLSLVLRLLGASRQPLSRAAVAAQTGLTRATVSALVDDLLAGHLLSEVEPAPRTGAGRPAAGLVLAGDGPAGLGLEINVDYLAACVVDLAGAVRHRVVHHADQRAADPQRALDGVARLAASVREAAERDRLVLAGAALAVPGLVAADGLVRVAPNLGWRDVDVAAALSRSPAVADLPLTVDNEANLAALGELHASPPGSRNFLYVSGEIGIGAGIVLDGALYRGARGWSGELGHVAVRPDGPRCRCGAHGCLEQYAGQEAILRAARLVDGTVQSLAERAAAGDSAALAALASAADALGVAVAGVVNLLDVDTVLLGGVYAPLASWLVPGITAELDRRVLTAAWSPVTVCAATLAGDAAVVGAAVVAVRPVRDNPERWLATCRLSSPAGPFRLR
jgi:predicted NBD/HSP70 family sugar kinase